MSTTQTIEKTRPGQWWTAIEQRGVDFFAYAQPGSSDRAISQSGDLRVYTSSLPGWLSVALRDYHGVIGGTRLTLDQAKALRQALDQHIAHAEGGE